MRVMKARSMWMMPLVPLALAAGLALPQDPGDGDDLKQEIADLEARIEALETYAQAQAKAATALSRSLDTSEDEGFVPGINFRSREVLLAAWRAQIDVATADVPGKKGSDKDEQKNGGGGGR